MTHRHRADTYETPTSNTFGVRTALLLTDVAEALLHHAAIDADDVAKLDVARFCVKEAMEPTYSRQGVVIASKLSPELTTYYQKYKYFHPGFWLSKAKRDAMNSA